MIHDDAPSPSRVVATWLLCAAIVSGAVGCGGAQAPTNARTTVVSMKNLTCAECGERLARDLIERDGVYKTRFDRRRAEVTVLASPAVDVVASAKALSTKEEYELVGGAGKGSYVAWTQPPPAADVEIVTRDGADVPDLATVLAKGKVTVVDFSAVWCEPCRQLDDHMVKLLESRSDVAYRKLDVGDWDTPLAQRYLRGVSSLPYVIVYDKTGEKIDAITGLDVAKLDAAIERGAK